MSESAYPYTGKSGTCKYSSSNTGVKTSGYTTVAAKSVSAMKTALAK